MERKGQVSIPLGDERKKELDKYCAEHGYKQKEVVIRAIDSVLKANEPKKINGGVKCRN